MDGSFHRSELLGDFGLSHFTTLIRLSQIKLSCQFILNTPTSHSNLTFNQTFVFSSITEVILVFSDRNCKNLQESEAELNKKPIAKIQSFCFAT